MLYKIKNVQSLCNIEEKLVKVWIGVGDKSSELLYYS